MESTHQRTLRFTMNSPLLAVVFAAVMFAAAAWFFLGAGDVVGDRVLALVCGYAAAGLAALSVVALVNLLTHEGWAVVLGTDALELPVAPYRSRRRDRIPYSRIELVGLAPSPPAQPTHIVIHVMPGPRLRWIRDTDLTEGALEEIATALTERVGAAHGPGATSRSVRVEYE